MKKIIQYSSIFLYLFLLSCDLATGNQFNYQQDIFDQAEVFNLESTAQITIFISTNEWNTLLTNFDTLSKNEENVHADFLFEKYGRSVKINDVGFRLRGNYSRRRPEGLSTYGSGADWMTLHGQTGTNVYRSAHFRLGFDAWQKGQDLGGLKNLNLKWFKDDPNYSREIYCYDLFRRFGVTAAPRASYAFLTIRFKETGETVFFGPYAMIESLEKAWAKDRYPLDSNGYLWKCLHKNDNPADLTYPVPANSIGIEQTSLTSVWTPTYDLKTRKDDFNAAKYQLEQFIYQLNTLSGSSLKSWLDATVDVDNVLRTLAVGIVVGSWDSYWMLGQNYYLYFPEKGKLILIPFDYDNTLGTALNTFGGNTGTNNVINIYSQPRPLIDKILSIPEYRNRYYAYLKLLINPEYDFFDYEASTSRILQWRSLISTRMPEIQVAPSVENWFNTIDDFPAFWADYDSYRLFSGDDSGDGVNMPGANYFKSRAQSIAYQLKIPGFTWSNFLHNYSKIYLIGSFTGWTNGIPMQLVADHTWQLTISNFTGNWYKFIAHPTNWNYPDWGDPDHNGIADQDQDPSMVTVSNGLVTFTFNEVTLEYSPVD